MLITSLVRSQVRILPPYPTARGAAPPRQRTLKLAPVGGIAARGFPPARAPPITLTARAAPAPSAPPTNSGAGAGVLPATIIEDDGRFQESSPAPPRCPRCQGLQPYALEAASLCV